MDGQVYDYLGLNGRCRYVNRPAFYDASHVAKEEDIERDVPVLFKVFYDYLRPITKKEAYACDITYVTNNELGFDYLRDNTAYDAAQSSSAHFITRLLTK